MKCSYLVKYPRGEDGLCEVVKNEDTPEVEGLPILHNPRAEDLAEVGVRQANGDRRDGAAHHRPFLHSGICNIVNYAAVRFSRTYRRCY
jgi:hypothetical protein